jgi:hypothetical protein
MKIIIAGQDCTEELGGEVQRKAVELKKLKGRAAPPRVSAEIGALALHKSLSDADYLDHFVRLLRYRDAFDTYDFDIPRRPGSAGAIMAKIKKVLWKLLRYQHDRIAFRQNLINGLFTSAVEFEVTERKRKAAEIDRRLDNLEELLRKFKDKGPS